MIGDRLGKWVIFKELGRGGMGRVYLALEELTGQRAALKVLAAELSQEIGFLQRFLREIETLSKLSHPHIVQFIEAGHENGFYFYAMEYVEGQSLEQILESAGKLPWQQVLDVALQVTPAIRHVHDHGVIHRDLKPSNLLYSTTGQVKLTDFGIAKIFASTHLTATGGIVGTAEFLSPEQAAGKIVGRRSDLYSFGCVLYMLLTGRPPFLGSSYVELLHKHRYGQFDRPIKIVPEIPYDLDDVVCQLLEKDPDKRPRDALVFLKQLQGIRAKHERKNRQTEMDLLDRATMAENRTDKMSRESLPGPETLLSRMDRSGQNKPAQGSLVGRFFNRPLVLLFIMAACIGIITWSMWPLNQDEMFHRGAKLMESDSLYSMQRAWTEYLEPLETRYPDHPYKDQVAVFRRRLETARAPNPSEAQRFYQQAEMLQQQGNILQAQQVWRNLIDVFEDVEPEKTWVRRSRERLGELAMMDIHNERWQHVRTALEQARELQHQKKFADAERILKGIEQLYRNDPSAIALLDQVQKIRVNP